MGNSRVPETISEFNAYINNTDDHQKAISSGVITNRERLGWSATNSSDYTEKREYWRDELFPTYNNPLLCTSAVKTQVRDFMTEFREFANPLLNIMAASPNATSDDEAVYNFKIGRAEPVAHTEPIEDLVVFEVKPIGGGKLKFKCRTGTDTKRASKHPLADSVQVAYLILDDAPPSPGDPGGGADLPNPDDHPMTTETSTKASFTLELGLGKKRKAAIVYTRWYHTKHKVLAGPWRGPEIVVIA